MSYATIAASVQLPSPLCSSLIEGLRNASIAYSEACREEFEGVTAGLLVNDDVMLSALAEKIVKLAAQVSEAPGLCNFVDAKPDKAELVEVLADVAADALGGVAGALVRAHARVFAAA